MKLTYEEALKWIHGRLRLGMKPGLIRMEWMMEKLGHPEKKLKTVHIGGTNGKGSTVTFLRQMLEKCSYTVGTFTSPYIEEFNERISVNGKSISDDEIVALVEVIRPLAEKLDQSELGGPTEFEIITAMSFYYFAHIRPVDIVLYEVGLGGRFDSTNIIDPLVSIITSIGLDHTAILGDTHAKIAFEKAGIIKPGTPVVTAVSQQDALLVIKDVARSKEAPCYCLGEQFQIKESISLTNGEQFTLNSSFANYKNLHISMIGKHQTENASLAVMAAQLLKQVHFVAITDDSIRHGLQNAYWPGRFETVLKEPLVIIDGAHNEEGVATLVDTVQKRYHNRDIHVVFAALADKALDGMIHQLEQIASEMVFVDFDYPRAASKETLYQISKHPKKQQASDWKELLNQEISILHGQQMLLITGSLYFISEVKKVLGTMNKNSSN